MATLFSDKYGRKCRNHFIFHSTFSLWKDKSDAGVSLLGYFLSYRSAKAWPQVMPKSLSSSAPSPNPACLRGEGAAYPLFFGQHVCLVWLPRLYSLGKAEPWAGLQPQEDSGFAL